MQTVNWNSASEVEKNRALSRPETPPDQEITAKISAIFAEIKTGGDKALLAFTDQFDGVTLNKVAFDVPSSPVPNLDIEDEKAILLAAANIRKFHKAQLPIPVSIETQPGVLCEKVWRPMNSVGLYIPGGSAPLISTLLMLAIPAQIAGVKEIAIITPPQKGEGPVDKGILFVARLLGIKTIYLAGGAQAIAALTYGTQTVPAVDKLFGPGNLWVTEAKKYANSLPSANVIAPAIDMPAGPSEVMVLADNQANPAIVAADMLAQAEHDPLAQALLVCFTARMALDVSLEIDKQLKTLTRKEIATASANNMLAITCKVPSDALDVINKYAPEHLILNAESANAYLSGINNAGSVFVGPNTPEAAGDYASGTNHVLPTAGFARNYSGLSTSAFMKSITIQKIDDAGLKTLGPSIVRMANMEGLDGHAASVTMRLKLLEEQNNPLLKRVV
ncbi:MAG: histidinol dehydrogenase [Sphingomonadales bacterium]|nr:histidinol dehydrogenase [Sphingomonadales bacterium]